MGTLFMNKFNRKLHIYGQQSWHGDAYIIGNEQALLALRNGIDKALSEAKNAHTQFAADGEGYNVFVVCTNDGQINKMMLPYVVEEAAGKKGAHPIEILDKDYIRLIEKNRADDEKNK